MHDFLLFSLIEFDSVCNDNSNIEELKDQYDKKLDKERNLKIQVGLLLFFFSGGINTGNIVCPLRYMQIYLNN